MEKQFTLKDYQIGEFAKRMGVSSHFLKYYEETGILQPETHETGYRFYNMWDASIVLECKRMKNIGFSVKESRKILTDSTAPELDHLLQEHQSRLLEEIRQKQRTAAAIQNLRADLKFCLKKEWQICSSKPVWFLPHTVGQQFSGDKGVYQQLTRWADAMPTVRSTQRLTFLGDDQWQAEWGFSVPAEEAAAIGLKTSSPAVLMSTEKNLHPVHQLSRQPGTGKRAALSPIQPARCAHSLHEFGSRAGHVERSGCLHLKKRHPAGILHPADPGNRKLIPKQQKPRGRPLTEQERCGAFYFPLFCNFCAGFSLAAGRQLFQRQQFFL